MKLVLTLVVVAVANCRAYPRGGPAHHIHRRSDLAEGTRQVKSAGPQERHRSAFLKEGSPLSPESATALVLPTAFEKVDLPTFRSAGFDLPSSFHPKGSPLSPESATALVLPTAFEKVDLPTFRRMDIEGQTSYQPRGFPVAPEASTGRAYPTAFEVVDFPTSDHHTIVFQSSVGIPLAVFDGYEHDC